MTLAVTVNDAAYCLETHGQGERLLLLHGFTGSRRNWYPHLPALTLHFQVILVDLLGHGGTDAPSDPARYKMERAAADLAALIERLGASPVRLLGYSMGGRLALYVALQYPQLVSRLILESASPGLKTPAKREARRRQDEALAGFIEREGMAAFVARWEKLPLWASQSVLPASVREELRRRRLANRPAGLANSLRGMGSGVQPSLWSRLGELSQPVLLLCGQLDAKFLALNREMAEVTPHARLEIVSDAGHAVHLEQPARWLAAVRRFL